MRPDGTAAAEDLLAHLEAGLGNLDESRSVAESVLAAEDLGDFTIVALGRAADTFFATFGISRHRLGDGGVASLELVLATAEFDYAVDVLTTIGRHVLDCHCPVLAGERHRLRRWGDASAIGGVMAVPDPDLEPFAAASPPIEFVRLLPITDAEAAYAREWGWQKLAQGLMADDVDLRDLSRSSVV